MSVVFNLLSPLPSDRHLYNNPLGLAVHNNVYVVLILGLFHSNLLRLCVLVRVGNDLRDSEGGVCSVLPPQHTPQACSLVVAKRRSS